VNHHRQKIVDIGHQTFFHSLFFPPLPKGDAEKSSKQMLTIPRFLIGCPEGALSSRQSPGRGVDSYTLNLKILF
jgi:hypothetical protein